MIDLYEILTLLLGGLASGSGAVALWAGLKMQNLRLELEAAQEQIEVLSRKRKRVRKRQIK